MSLALLLVSPALVGGRLERAIRGLFVSGFVLAVAAFIGFWIVGHDLIAFEVAVLSINWIVLIVSGVLLAVVFRCAGRVAGICVQRHRRSASGARSRRGWSRVRILDPRLPEPEGMAQTAE